MGVRTFGVVIALLVFACGAGAQTVDPALTAASAARDKAAISRNADEVGKFTADDYLSINPTGQLMNKQQRVQGLRAPAAAGATPQAPLRTEAVRMYGANAAVARMKLTSGRHLYVWIKNAQGWQAAAIHVVSDAVPAPVTPPERPKTAQPSSLQTPTGLSGDRAAVFAAFKQVQDAFYAGDRAAYEKLTAPEHVRLLPGGLMRFGTENMGAIDGPRAQPKYANISVQAWGQVAVVRWLETGAAGIPTWLTRVFSKNVAGWQQVATASSAAGNPAVAP